MRDPQSFGLPGSREALTRAEQQRDAPQRTVILHLANSDTLNAGKMADDAIERFRVWVDLRSREKGQPTAAYDPEGAPDEVVRSVRFVEDGGSEWIVPCSQIVAVEVSSW